MTDPNPSPTTRIPTPGSGSEPDAPTDDATAPAPSEPPPPANHEQAAISPEPAAPPEQPGETPPPPPGPAPASSWGQHTQPRRDPGRWVSVVVGLVVLAVGLWLFAEVTLGIALPTIRWNQLWPVILIVIGGWIVLGTMRRGSR
jgi:uncharacterized membrane protein